MKQTKRVKAILDLLATTDKDELIFHYTDTGLFGIDTISRAVFCIESRNLQPHQLSSLYRTLRGLLDSGVIVARKEVESGWGAQLPTARRYYHLADKFNYDMDVIAEYQANKPSSEVLLKKLFG
jgi:hypothetical protein